MVGLMLTRGQQEPVCIPQWECVVRMQSGNEDASKGMPAVFVVSDGSSTSPKWRGRGLMVGVEVVERAFDGCGDVSSGMRE